MRPVAQTQVRSCASSPADRAALAALRRRWSEEDAGSPIEDPGFEERAAAWIEANESHRLAWLAEDGGQPVGFVTAIVVERMPTPGSPDSGWGYVHHLFVVPERRSSGVGARLLAAVVAEARARGWEQLLLRPRPRSRPFYERAGFIAGGDRFLVLRLSP